MLFNTNNVNADIDNSYFILSAKIQNVITMIKKSFCDIAIVCIGTDRSTGDSYGPLVGHILTGMLENKLPNVAIYGTLHKPVHAQNIETAIKVIDTSKSLVIAVDASMGKEKNIGKIMIEKKCLYPGSGLNKNLSPIGDISIRGIVNSCTNNAELSFLKLQCTRLSLVYDLANRTAKALYSTLTQSVQFR